ncbi:MAG: hypothetical protein WDO13_10525 [Verrucomicrobiota bacterium]
MKAKDIVMTEKKLERVLEFVEEKQLTHELKDYLQKKKEKPDRFADVKSLLGSSARADGRELRRKFEEAMQAARGGDGPRKRRASR